MKVGDVVFKFTGDCFYEYKCTAVVQRDKSVQYELVCVSCDYSHENCVVLVQPYKDKEDVFSFVSMVNYDNEDNYALYHKSPYDKFGKYLYYASLGKCLEAVEQGNRNYYLENIKKKEQELEEAKKALEKYERDEKAFREKMNLYIKANRFINVEAKYEEKLKLKNKTD